MQVLVFGRTGQVARELGKLLPDAEFLGRDQADLQDPASCAGAVLSFLPDVVINAAAFTGVDAAETDTETAHVVNAEAPGAIARVCAAREIPFVHVSTDFVFDGFGTRPFRPEDKTGPLGAYGRSKAKGEEAVRMAAGIFAILRTSWVFSAHGSNFVKTMLRLSETRDELNVVADQVGGPTPADAIAAACVTIAQALVDDPRRAGTYHFSGRPDVSWAGFAREIFRQAGRETIVNDIPAADYPRAARVPANSRLDCTSTEMVFGIRRPDWKDGLARVLRDLEAAT